MVEMIALNIDRAGLRLVLAFFGEFSLVRGGHRLAREFESELVRAYNVFGLH